MTPKFTKNQIVRKVVGARFWGRIINEPYKTPLNDVWHYDVCAIHPDFFGTTHIMVKPQMAPFYVDLDTMVETSI